MEMYFIIGLAVLLLAVIVLFVQIKNLKSKLSSKNIENNGNLANLTLIQEKLQKFDNSILTDVMENDLDIKTIYALINKMNHSINEIIIDIIAADQEVADVVRDLKTEINQLKANVAKNSVEIKANDVDIKTICDSKESLKENGQALLDLIVELEAKTKLLKTDLTKEIKENKQEIKSNKLDIKENKQEIKITKKSTKKK